MEQRTYLIKQIEKALGYPGEDPIVMFEQHPDPAMGLLFECKSMKMEGLPPGWLTKAECLKIKRPHLFIVRASDKSKWEDES